MKGALKNLAQTALGRLRKKSPISEENAVLEGDVISRIQVSDIFPELGTSANELIHISSGLVMHSNLHALAKALLSRGTDMLVTPMLMEHVDYIPQKAFIGKNDLGEFWFGYADYFQSEGVDIPISLLNMMRLHFADDKETFLVAKDKQIIGLISLQQI